MPFFYQSLMGAINSNVQYLKNYVDTDIKYTGKKAQLKYVWSSIAGRNTDFLS